MTLSTIRPHFQEMDRLVTMLKGLPAQVLDHDYSNESFGTWSMTIRATVSSVCDI
jgi:hypothetical protein